MAEKKIDEFRELFNASSKYGWFLPLTFPFFLCFLSMNAALKTTGLMADRVSLTNAVTTIANYTDTLRNVRPQPIITVHEHENGIRESRLVVRALGFEEVGNDVIWPFMLPLFSVVLIGGFGCAMILRYKATAKDTWVLWSRDFLIVGNMIALVWFLGVSGLLTLMIKHLF